MNQLIQIPHRFLCRKYQENAWNSLQNGKKRAILCWHRGAGKDLFALNFLISQMVEFPGVYLHCFPNYSQAKKAIWNSTHDTSKGENMSYLDHFPEELIENKNSSDMMIRLKNGAIYCLMGVDGKNAQRARGMNPRFVIMSEYAYMDVSAWETIEPRIIQNNGTALFVSTPNGQNHFYDLYNYAVKHPEDFFSSLLTVKETNTVSEQDIEIVRGKGTPEDFIQQEFYCSFTRGAQGSYYGKLIQKAREENRITELSVNPSLPCYTAWDIGIGDSTALWIFQPLENGKYNFVHYYENHGENIEHYCKYLDSWKSKHDIIWGRHFVPHDMKNDEFIAGIDRVEAARRLGFNVDVLERIGVDEGINMSRSILPFCNFDVLHCKHGIKALDLYCKKYNDILKVYYDTPLHNQYSHGADAFRYACQGIKTFGTALSSMTPEKLRQLQAKAGYGPKPTPIQRPPTNQFPFRGF